MLFLGSPVCSSVRSFVWSDFFLPWYLLHDLNNFDKNDREYSTDPTDDPIRFWRLNVKVTADCQGQMVWTSYLSNLYETTIPYLSHDYILGIKGQGHAVVQACGTKASTLMLGCRSPTSIYRLDRGICEEGVIEWSWRGGCGEILYCLPREMAGSKSTTGGKSARRLADTSLPGKRQLKWHVYVVVGFRLTAV